MGWFGVKEGLTRELMESSIVSFESVDEDEEDGGRVGHRSLGR